MPAMVIRIPDAHEALDGSIECRPDEQGNILYIERDDGVYGEPTSRSVDTPPVGARLRIEVIS